MPPENLLQPDAVRRLAWTPPQPITAETVADALRANGARAWQLARVAEPLAEALPEPEGEAVAPSAREVEAADVIEEPVVTDVADEAETSSTPPAPNTPPPFSG